MNQLLVRHNSLRELPDEFRFATAAYGAISTEPVERIFPFPTLDDEQRQRCERLAERLTVIAMHVNDFPYWCARYVLAVPSAKTADNTNEGERFLEWLRAHRNISVEENDAVCCQSACLAIETMVGLNLRRHEQFQNLWQESSSSSHTLRDKRCWVVLNPIHVWVSLQSSLFLSDESPEAVQIVVFPVASTIRMRRVSPAAQRLIRHLTEVGACHYEELFRLVSEDSRIDIPRLCREFIEQGLLAWN